jgi:hypothetical protein
MSDTFLLYIQRLELIAFFAGYPLFYAIVSVVPENRLLKKIFNTKPVALLPYSYALIATLYLGLQFKTYYSAGTFSEQFRLPMIVIWGLLANLFWIPFLAKKPVISLLHSLIFFFPVVKDILLQVTKYEAATDIVRNDMKLYTISIAIHFAAFISVSLMYALYRSLRVKK